MNENKFTWVKTHKELVEIIRKKRNQQSQLIDALKKVGISGLHDENAKSERFELKEIDPFSFFCYIYKYGNTRRLKHLQEIAESFKISIPSDDNGIPSVNAQKVCLFPFESNRKNNEISRLWDVFESALSASITDKQFEDVLQINSTGKTKLTEGLFNVAPDKFFPINGPTKPYLKEVLGIDPNFKSYSEYNEILSQIKQKSNSSFYELSYEAWKWKVEQKEINYWIFQGNPDLFDFENALRQEVLTDWTVNSHKSKINIGDKVILWITGNHSGCYALAEVTSKPHKKTSSPDDYLWKEEDSSEVKADIRITHNLVDIPILKKEIKSYNELENMKVGNQGTNFTATKDEYEKILELSQNHNGKKYWLYAPGENASKWEEFYEQGIMGLGWDEIGDLNQLGDRDDITKTIQDKYNTKSKSYNNALANIEFRDFISIGDIIIPKKGRQTYLGYGVVTSDYYYDTSRDSYKKCRKVDWKKKGVWDVPEGETVIKTLTDITKYPDYVRDLIDLIGIEKTDADLKFTLNTILYGPPGTGKTYNTVLRAAEIIENRKIDSYNEALNIFKANLHDQIEFVTFHQNYSYEDFIQGLRPDTKDDNDQLKFKKYDGIFKVIADRALTNIKESKKEPEEISQVNAFEEALEKLKDKILESEEPIKINDTAYFIAVEDDAFRYSGDNWTLKEKGFNGFRMKYSDLKRFFEKDVKSRKEIKNLEDISGLAKQHATYFIKAFELVKSHMPTISGKTPLIQKKNYVLIIDEINRANISRVFGELITLIEPDKRWGGEIPIEAKLPSGDTFVVPSNLYIVGTMNTADKSIALLDIALRRRFEFESVYPKYEINGQEIYDVDILKKINEQIIKSKGHDFQIGHAYFMGENKDLVQRMNKKVIPLLLEYYMNDEKEVKGILQSVGLKIEDESWPIRITGRND